MNFRHAVAAAFVVLSIGCPPPSTSPDGGGPDGSSNQQTGPCTGGCGPNQICDERTHQCVDACGGCDAGVCVKSASGQFQCVPPKTTCNGTQCGFGQAACLGGGCSCLTFTRASKDTCAAEGQVCRETYNAVTMSGGSCQNPRIYEACRTEGCPSGQCAACEPGGKCVEVFGGLDPLCTRDCTTHAQCNGGELCSQDGCLPATLFGVQNGTFACQTRLSDGGLAVVPVSNTCLLKDANAAPTENLPSGNCTYQFLRFSNFEFASSICRPPGAVGLYGACKRDFRPTATATQCGTGLECMLHDGEQRGMCFKMCNAASTPGVTPGCGADEACVNLYRQEDNNGVVGVCLKKCNVFVAGQSTCQPYGNVQASCVPMTADGRSVVSTDGSGICVPQRTTIAQPGQGCAEPDAFKGAACGNAQVCIASTQAEIPVCEQACDVECAGANPPARCQTEPNARCTAGKTCKRVTTTTGAILGFCR